MKQYRYITLILMLAILAFFLIACDNTPIFFALEKAYQTSDDRGLKDDIEVIKIVYATPANRYFINAQSVFQRDEGDSGTWKRVPPPASGALCGGLEFFGSEIIAWFYNSKDGKPVGLYSRDPSSATSAPWTEITDVDWPLSSWSDLRFSIHFVKAVNGLLFVSTSVYHADESDPDYKKTFYNLEYTPAANLPIDSNNEFDQINLTDFDRQIVDVEYDSVNYWFMTILETTGTPPTFLYRGGTPTGFSEDGGRPDFSSVSGDPAGTLYTPQSLYVDSGDTLYLSGWQGRVYFNDGGGWSAWSGDPVTVEEGNSNYTVQFRGFVETGRPSEFFVGTNKYGYYRFTTLTDPVSAADLTRQPSQPLYESPPPELVKGAVYSFLADTEDPGNMIFACTANAGLWRGDWDGVKWKWKQE
jgi:hypothetical protein